MVHPRAWKRPISTLPTKPTFKQLQSFSPILLPAKAGMGSREPSVLLYHSWCQLSGPIAFARTRFLLATTTQHLGFRKERSGCGRLDHIVWLIVAQPDRAAALPRTWIGSALAGSSGADLVAVVRDDDPAYLFFKCKSLYFVSFLTNFYSTLNFT